MTKDQLEFNFCIGNNVYGVVLEEGTNYIKSFSTAVVELFISASDNKILCEWQWEIQRQYDREEFQLLRVSKLINRPEIRFTENI